MDDYKRERGASRRKGTEGRDMDDDWDDEDMAEELREMAADMDDDWDDEDMAEELREMAAEMDEAEVRELEHD
jgi:hypothetical protein